MADAVISGMDASEALWNETIPIADAVLKTKGHLGELHGLVIKQASGITQGATRILQSNLSAMVGLAMQVIQKLRPFAIATDKEDLLPRIDFSNFDIAHGKQIDALSKCTVVLNEGRKYQPEMADYKLSVEELDALEAAINGVAMLSGNRDAIIGKRKTATDGIPVLIDRIRTQLEMLDDLVPALVGDADFVQTYKNNRRIIDR